jgi:hypothetical protein
MSIEVLRYLLCIHLQLTAYSVHTNLGRRTHMITFARYKRFCLGDLKQSELRGTCNISECDGSLERPLSHHLWDFFLLPRLGSVCRNGEWNITMRLKSGIMCTYRIGFYVDVRCTGICQVYLLALNCLQGGRKLLKIVCSYSSLSLDYYCYFYHRRRRRQACVSYPQSLLAFRVGILFCTV